MVYLNQFDPILTPRKLRFWKKIDFFLFFFFVKKTDKVSKKFLFFRKLTQIAVIFMVLKLNYHKNSQRYIEFNFDPKNNFFQLKSGIFIKFRKFCKLLGPKLEIWRFIQFDFSSSNPQKIIILGDIISLGGWKHIYCIQSFHFFIKKVSLSVSHQYARF